MPRYRTLDTLDHNGRRYAPGDPIDLPTAAAAPLVAIGVIKAAAPASRTKKPAKPAPEK